MSDMQEIELKFQIPSLALASLQAELRALPEGDRPPQRLQAAYFDTADRKLARARAALRVRQEDEDWVQTLKAAGANAMTRLEDNQPVPPFPPGAVIRPDLSRHVEEHVRQALMRDLGWHPETDPQGAQTGLLLLYRTDMRRARANLDTFLATPRPSHPGQVEIALDLGDITAGSLRRPVQELEIELTEGDPRAVLDVARDLVRRHGLWLDTQTKAHRGDQLAREAESGQASPMPPARPRTRVKPGASAVQMWVASVDAALDQIGACFSEVALCDIPHAGHDMASGILNPEPWIKGWATGLRRLGWLWRHVPEAMEASGTLPSHPSLLPLRRELTEQLRTLRPRAGRYLDGDAAAAFARSAAPSLLAIDVLEVILAAQA
jgi:triphosphatase